MLLILVTVVTYIVTMSGLAMILFSKKLWARTQMPFLERLEPTAIAGFLCFFIGVAIICGLFLLF